MTLAADALTHLAYAAAAFLLAAAAWEITRPRGRRGCRCGHDWDAHHHYGSSGRTYCSTCACDRYRPARPPAAGDTPPPGAAATATPSADRTRQPGHQPDGIRIRGPIAWACWGRPCGCTGFVDDVRGIATRTQCRDHEHFGAWAREMKETR